MQRLGGLPHTEVSSARRLACDALRVALLALLALLGGGQVQWQRDLSVILDRLGDLAQAGGDLPPANRHHQAGLAIAERAGRRRPQQHPMAARPSASASNGSGAWPRPTGDPSGDLPAAAEPSVSASWLS